MWQWTPVVFFTTSGVPGEVTEGMDSAHGALAACMRALRLPGDRPPVYSFAVAELAFAALCVRCIE